MPFKVSTIKEQVYDAIKDKILNGEIKPGDWLQEKELASEFRVSRSPIREALKELAVEGLVINIPNKGVFVRKMDEKDIVDILDLRILLERYAIEKTIELLNEDGVVQLNSILDRLEELFKTRDVNEYSKEDANLHNTLVRLSGNELAYTIMIRYFSIIQPFRAISLHSRSRFDGSIVEHRNLVKAIVARNFAEAWKWDSQHLNLAKEEILKAMEKMKG